MSRVLVAAALIVLLPAVVPAETAQQQTPQHDQPAPESTEPVLPPDILSLLGSATEDQRGRMLRFIRNRYPDLTTELLTVLQSHHPDILVQLDGEISALMSARYPRLSADMQRLLQRAISERYPQVRKEIAELIAESYPDLLEAMQEAGEGEAARRTARLIQESHRQLLDDVMSLLRDRHPTLLVEVRRELLVKNSSLLVDVGKLVAKKYPDVSLAVALKLAERYPELIPGILQILLTVPGDEQADE